MTLFVTVFVSFLNNSIWPFQTNIAVAKLVKVFPFIFFALFFMVWSWPNFGVGLRQILNPDGGKERPMVGRLWSLGDVFGHLVMLWGYVWSLGQLWWGRLMTERVSQSLVGWCRACPLPTTHSLRNRALVTHILSYHRITTLPFWPTPKTSRISFPLPVLRR